MTPVYRDETKAKAVAIFVNSTPGRLQLMRSPGRTLEFPTYSAAEVSNLRIPDIHDNRIVQILEKCWEKTKDIEVPQFREGDCEVRKTWDDAIAKAMGWDAGYLTELRQLLGREPHVRGRGYNEYDEE